MFPWPFGLKHACQPFGGAIFSASAFCPIVTAMALAGCAAASSDIEYVTKEQFVLKITAAGLDDAQVFEAVRFTGVDDLISSLYPKTKVTLEGDAMIHAKVLMATAADRASFARRVEDDGLPGGLSDSLWAAGMARERARKAVVAEPTEAFIDRLGKGSAKKRQGPASSRRPISS